MYPKATPEKFEDFMIGLSDMAGHVQFKNASYMEAMDLNQDIGEEQE